MALTGFYILGAGVVLSFLSFIFAAANMGGGMTGKTGFDTMVGGHLAAMMGMAAGGLVSILGIIVAIVNAIQFYG